MPLLPRLRITWFALPCLALFCARASGAVIWNEGVNGDLSGNRSAPTVLTVSVGNNTIIGTTGGGDLEYFTINIPAGKTFTAMLLDSYASADNVAFIAIQSGNIFTQPNTGTNVTQLLGYTHFGPGGSPVGSNLLTSMGTGSGAMGFIPPLASGNYVFWAQQLGASTNYQFNLQVVPEPSTYALLLGCLMSGVVLIRRRVTS